MKKQEIAFSALKTSEYEKEFKKGGKKRVFSYAQGEEFLFSSAVEKIFGIGEDIYLLSSDGFFYKRENGTFLAVSSTQFGTDLKFLPVTYNGEKATLVVTPSTAEIDCGETSLQVSVPYGILRFYAGRLFVASGKTLYYGDLFNFTSCGVGNMRGGFIETENEDGDIVGIEEKDGKLFMICENAVLSLTAFTSPEEFKMERVCANSGAQAGSVAKVGDRIYFIGEEGLKRFDGKKTETASVTLAGEVADGDAESYCGKYVITVKRNGVSHTYVYEDFTGAEDIIGLPDHAVSDGAVTAQSSVGKVMRLTASYAFFSGETQDESDFGTSKEKVAIAADMSVTGSAVFNISGKTETVSKQVTGGENYLRFNVAGRKFSVSFTGASSDFSVNRFKIIYAVTGG